jgi:hypothetical protein
MDSSFSIKPRPGVHKAALRDPAPVREAVGTELNAGKTVNATGDGAGKQSHDNRHGEQQRPEHLPHDVTVDPQSREMIYRERDVRAADREHPDQALQRQRAYGHHVYGQQAADSEAPPPDDPHADIKA